MKELFIAISIVAGAWFAILLVVFGILHFTNSEPELRPLEQSAREMNAKVISIFNFTITEDSYNRSMQDIELNGGDCFDYTRYYENLSLSKNITGSRVPVGNHIFYAIFDNTGYCVLDQKLYKCVFYNNSI